MTLASEYNRENFVLIVDDDQTLLKFFKIHLNKFFSHVVVVKSPKEALEALKEKQIDLVISDIRMPRMDGFQLLRKIRLHDASIPIILISGALLTEEQISETQNLANGFLSKPFSVDDLHSTISQGLVVRAELRKLTEIVKDNKTILKLIEGTGSPKDLLSAKDVASVQEILNRLKAS